MTRRRRVVVKLGSGVLSGGSPRLVPETLRRIAREVAGLKSAGREVVLVSSGAILAGTEALELGGRPSSIPLKQAAAAVGQSRLMRVWADAFHASGVLVGQVLLTRDDMRHRERYLNARNTLFALLKLGAVPVINENDTVAIDEIKFGDNDVLSSLVAGLVDAGLLVLLTDQEGLYSADPRKDPAARLIENVRPDESLGQIGKPGPWGSGGMESKVRAARMSASAGISAVIASGLKPGVLGELILEEGRRGTLFMPRDKPMDKRSQWLAYASSARGVIHVDQGAHEALVGKSRSLLPSGVKSVSRVFEPGDVVSLASDGMEFARGLTNYGSRELERIKGLKTAEIEAVLGYKPADEVVHRDNLVVIKP